MSKRVCISGFFDPIHPGHIRYIQEASKLGDVIVILNTDPQLMMKKGYVFMPFEERKEVLQSIKGVKEVIDCIDKDYTSSKTLELIKPDMFLKGGDRRLDNIPEKDICEKLGIEMIFGVGGYDKPQSSSWLVEKFIWTIKSNKELKKKYGL
jgi:D-beta-D-heptose 7-phosphate kinase/D-beta-D-heptose 1-phosphate adenosyltransferase